MNEQLYIPQTIKVGYNERSDTYTGKLAYVVYIDQKGKLRKETSWKDWIQPKLGVDDFDNSPLSGFVLNKGVGGARERWGWNARNEKIRIYDPRGFEFEITIANLLFILSETTSFQGKGLDGDFVYAWDKSDLVLIPTCSLEYKKSKEFTSIQAKKVKSSEMIIGGEYENKKQEPVIYLGKFMHYDYRTWSSSSDCTPSKKHVVYNVKRQNYEAKSDLTSIASEISSTPVSNLSDLIEKLLLQPCFGVIDKFWTEDVKLSFKSTYRKPIADDQDYVLPDKVYLKTDGPFGNTFDIFKFTAHKIKNENHANGYYSYGERNYTFKTFTLTKVSTIEIDLSGEIIIKELSKKAVTLYDRTDLPTLQFIRIALKLKNNSKTTLHIN